MRVVARLVITLCLLGGAVVAAPSAAGSAASACTVPPDVTVRRGVHYVNDNLPQHTLDVYTPKNVSGEPVVEAVHGGGWHSGSSDALCAEAIYFAQNGFAAFSINYTLTDLSDPNSHSWPTSYTDTETAARWIVAHAAGYGADGTRFAAFGTSAGGELVGLLDTKGREDGFTSTITTVALSGPMDLHKGYQEAAAQQQKVERAYLGCTPFVNCDQQQDLDASPDHHVASGDGSVLFFNSDHEIIPLNSAQLMNQALASAGVPHRLVVLRNSTLHARAYECVPVTIGGVTDEVVDQTVRWLGLQLNGVQTVPTGTFCSP